jgi:hypothetical protein
MKPIKLKSLLKESSRERKLALLKKTDVLIVNLKNALRKDFDNETV